MSDDNEAVKQEPSRALQVTLSLLAALVIVLAVSALVANQLPLDRIPEEQQEEQDEAAEEQAEEAQERREERTDRKEDRRDD